MALLKTIYKAPPQCKIHDLTEKDKRDIFADYLKHLEQGLKLESWTYRDDKKKVYMCNDTMEKYIREFPESFPPIKAKDAYMKGYRKWQKVVHASADGTNPKASTASLQMLMRNKFRWDKVEEDTAHNSEALTDTLELAKQNAELLKIIAELEAKLNAQS